jgi:hypothetical protein
VDRAGDWFATQKPEWPEEQAREYTAEVAAWAAEPLTEEQANDGHGLRFYRIACHLAIRARALLGYTLHLNTIIGARGNGALLCSAIASEAEACRSWPFARILATEPAADFVALCAAYGVK